MATPVINPTPPKGALSVGAYTEFLEWLDAMSAHLAENSTDVTDTSSASSETDEEYDPTVHTVAEFRAAIVLLRAAVSDAI